MSMLNRDRHGRARTAQAPDAPFEMATNLDLPSSESPDSGRFPRTNTIRPLSENRLCLAKTVVRRRDRSSASTFHPFRSAGFVADDFFTAADLGGYFLTAVVFDADFRVVYRLVVDSLAAAFLAGVFFMTDLIRWMLGSNSTICSNVGMTRSTRDDTTAWRRVAWILSRKALSAIFSSFSSMMSAVGSCRVSAHVSGGLDDLFHNLAKGIGPELRQEWIHRPDFIFSEVSTIPVAMATYQH